MEYTETLAALAKWYNLKLHIDGARIMNAAVVSHLLHCTVCVKLHAQRVNPVGVMSRMAIQHFVALAVDLNGLGRVQALGVTPERLVRSADSVSVSRES